MLKKIRQVEQVFRDMEKSISLLNKRTNVNCPPGCILCCLKPDLEASVLEFLPLAKYLVEANLHEEVITKIEEGQTICISLRTEKEGDLLPGCMNYAKRGAICRLFGSAVIHDLKKGKKLLYACKTLKENYAPQWEAVHTIIEKQETVPVVSDYYYRLYAIDHHLASDYNPINVSILKAINIALLHLAHK